MKKSLIKLGVVAVLIIAVAFLALNGLQVGKYILIPAADGITRGNDFAKSTYVVLNVNEPAAEVSEETEEFPGEEETADDPGL